MNTNGRRGLPVGFRFGSSFATTAKTEDLKSMRMIISICALLLAFAPPSNAFSYNNLFDSVIKEYRGIFIGTPRETVHEKLGKPKEALADEDDFEISNNETARVFYTADKKVKAIVVTYSGNMSDAPKPVDVLGEPVEPRPDGGMYKMVRLEEKGFWVSYVKVAGDNPSVIITVQEFRKAG